MKELYMSGNFTPIKQLAYKKKKLYFYLKEISKSRFCFAGKI